MSKGREKQGKRAREEGKDKEKGAIRQETGNE